MKKRILSAIIILLVLSASLTGCGLVGEFTTASSDDGLKRGTGLIIGEVVALEDPDPNPKRSVSVKPQTLGISYEGKALGSDFYIYRNTLPEADSIS